ncbi:MAG: hypothetical protein J6B87_06605 [Clostridia bacterium]|nr:hypothetical protein [Clostridia bacterium]
MKKKFFIVKWSELYGVVDSIEYKFLVIASSKEEAENKIRSAKGVTEKLEIVECNSKDGIIYLGTN